MLILKNFTAKFINSVKIVNILAILQLLVISLSSVFAAENHISTYCPNRVEPPRRANCHNYRLFYPPIASGKTSDFIEAPVLTTSSWTKPPWFMTSKPDVNKQCCHCLFTSGLDSNPTLETVS